MWSVHVRAGPCKVFGYQGGWDFILSNDGLLSNFIQSSSVRCGGSGTKSGVSWASLDAWE